MPYEISYRGIEGQTNLFARVSRVLDSYFWDEISDEWDTTESGDCNILLVESSTPGLYAATANFGPASDQIYSTAVYASTQTGALITFTDITSGVCSTAATEGAVVGGYINIITGDNAGFYSVDAVTADVSITLNDVTQDDTGSPGTGYQATVALIMRSEEIYRPTRLTVLQIINEIQKELSFPKSTGITDPHADTLLSYLNKTLDLMTDNAVWDDLKVKGEIAFAVGRNIYQVNAINAGAIDFIDDIQIALNTPLLEKTDADFRADVTSFGVTPAQPVRYRKYGRSGDSLLIEIHPTPDVAYTADIEMVQRQSRLTDAADVPRVDSQVLVLGGIYMALDKAGLDADTALAEFHAKIGANIITQGDSNFTDVTPV